MNIAIFGATSGIAQAAAHRWAQRGDSLILIGRDPEKLTAMAADLKSRFQVEVDTLVFDFRELSAMEQLVHDLYEKCPVDRALIAFGSLPDQSSCQMDAGQTESHLVINFVSPLVLINLVIGQSMERRLPCRMGVITSVAGVRGRQSNYIYGAAKGGLSKAIEGIQHRLHGHPIKVTDIRPGFVATAMTAHLSQGPLFVAPESIAPALIDAIDRGKPVRYLPGFWRWIMLIIRCLPRWVFHRTKL